MGAIIGLECKVYLNTGASYASPTWTEVDCIQDATLDLQWEEADASSRGSQFRQLVASIGTLEVSGSAIRDKDNAAFVALDLAARNKTIVDVVVLDGSILLDESQGYRFEGQVFSWTRNEALADVVAHDFTIKPTLSANAPVFFEGETP